MAKKTELAVMDSFKIANRFDGMDPELMAELQDQMEDLDSESGISCRMVKIPSGGGLAYEVQGDDEDDVEYMKEVSGVIVFTHRLNAYWEKEYGAGDDGDKIPVCSSMDGKVGIRGDTGEVCDCEHCPLNAYGTDIKGGKGKACKNMRRVYIMMDNDPNLYLLTVPPTSIKDVNKQLARIMGTKGIPYTGLIVSFKLEKATNAGGIAYSKVTIDKKGILPPAVAEMAKELRRQIKGKYTEMAITMNDYNTGTSAAHDAASDSGQAGATAGEAEFTEAAPADDLPFKD